jgi:phosphatidylserine/phosphatidylglycerophosphate/cardiolipin synthase-like enzyme
MMHPLFTYLVRVKIVFAINPEISCVFARNIFIKLQYFIAVKLKHLLIILCILFAAGLILVEIERDTIKTKIVEPLTLVNDAGEMSVYFCPQDDCEQVLIDELNSSSKIECAFYDLTEKRTKNILTTKNASVVVFAMNYDGFGIPRNTSGLMHSKFCVLDGKTVITGSHNPTAGNENKDNLLIVESKYIAENYEKEFDNLVEGKLGEEKTKVKYPKIIYNNYTLENYFCPQDGCQDQILGELNAANSSIYFLTFTFTDKEIAKVLVDKKKAGLDVRGVIESYQGRTYWVYPTLTSGNITVVLDNEKTLQHSKVFIIDNKTVVTGSFNPTRSADTMNDENIIILRQPNIALEYLEEFNYLFAALSES